ncbi:MAG: hypothetical protein RLY57_178 [Candidatus Parcubacteria bacterium]|jgi:hypothetical protein
MKNKQKGFIGIVITILIALVTVGGGVYVYQENKVAENIEIDNTVITTSNESQVKTEEKSVEKNLVTQMQKCGLVVTSLAANSKVSFPLTVKGTVDNSATNCSWQMFEGQAGTAQLFFNYENKGWKPIGVSVPVKVADWTAKTTSFEIVLNFNNGGVGIPSGTPMKIVFTAENAAAIEPSETVEVPIILDIKTNQQVTTKSYLGASYGFSYPSDWEISEANPVIGLTIAYPKSKADQVMNKTILTTDRVNISLVENKYIDLSSATKITLNGQTWYTKNLGMTDGGTENTVEYYKVYNSTKYVVIDSGMSNKTTIEFIATSFTQG